jgi:hypothetical protein
VLLLKEGHIEQASRDIRKLESDILVEFCVTNPHFLFTNDLLAQKRMERSGPLDLNGYSEENSSQMTMGTLLLLYSPWLLLEIVVNLYANTDVDISCQVAIRLLDLESSPIAAVVFIFHVFYNPIHTH